MLDLEVAAFIHGNGKTQRERKMMYPEVGAPDGFREMLEKLLPRIAVHVPDELLKMWFPPGVVDGAIDTSTLKAARAYADECKCAFSYLSAQKEGVFHKDPPKEIRTAGSLI
jgi:hypothetical protein